MLKDVLKGIRSFLFPQQCIFCNENTKISDNFVCEGCKNTLPYTKPPFCLKCGKPKRSCICGTLGGLWFSGVTAPFKYDKKGKSAVAYIKFKGCAAAIPYMANYIYLALCEKYSDDMPFDVITFVPMTKKSIHKRGYNQAELLAKSLSKLTGIPLKSLLKKVMNTPSQHKLNMKKRRINLIGCFQGDEKANGLRILLVDDVMTTGATLNECAKALSFYGAKSISCAVLATTEKI